MNIKGAMPFWKNAACHVTAQKSTFFSSQKNWGKFCFWADDSYVEKSEKNIDAKSFTLSIAVFPELATWSFSFFLHFSINAITSL